MIDTTSKRALPDWYRATAIQQVRPVDVDELTSERYFEKWDRADEKDIQKIASLFFKKIVQLEKPRSGCFLFDTTNYYTYMAGQTDSDLAKRGKNKEGKDWRPSLVPILSPLRFEDFYLFVHGCLLLKMSRIRR